MGLKPTDYLCLPLTAEEHARLHNEGEKSYWARHSRDPAELIKCELLVFIAKSERFDYADLVEFIVSCHE